MDMNLNVTKVCRTCLEQKNELISLYSVDNMTGIQLCDMILQITSQVQVNFVVFEYFVKNLQIKTLFSRYLQKKTHHLRYVPSAITN